MFGYATDETEECMPLTIVLAHKLNAKLAELRRSGALPWLRPDSKTQVRYQWVHKALRSPLFLHLASDWCPLAGDSAVHAGPWGGDPNPGAHHCDLSAAR